MAVSLLSFCLQPTPGQLGPLRQNSGNTIPNRQH
jgi:hypothetical protein